MSVDGDKRRPGKLGACTSLGIAEISVVRTGSRRPAGWFHVGVACIRPAAGAEIFRAPITSRSATASMFFGGPDTRPASTTISRDETLQICPLAQSVMEPATMPAGANHALPYIVDSSIGLGHYRRLGHFGACALIDLYFHFDLHFHSADLTPVSTPRAAHRDKNTRPSWNR